MWACGFSAVVFAWLRQWLRVRAIVAVDEAVPTSLLPFRVRSTTASMEPGVFGIFRPVLLLPEGIVDRLSAGQNWRACSLTKCITSNGVTTCGPRFT